MNKNIMQLKEIFHGTALRAIYKWSKPVHGSILIVSFLGVITSLMSLGVTMVTKGLIDGATGGREAALWSYGVALVALIAFERLISIITSYIRVKASAKLQKHLQRLVTSSMIGKEYPSLKPFHSGELVSRVFSDVSVVKGGVLLIAVIFDVVSKRKTS